jgi:hypothetical protein
MVKDYNRTIVLFSTRDFPKRAAAVHGAGMARALHSAPSPSQ